MLCTTYLRDCKEILKFFCYHIGDSKILHIILIVLYIKFILVQHARIAGSHSNHINIVKIQELAKMKINLKIFYMSVLSRVN